MRHPRFILALGLFFGAISAQAQSPRTIKAESSVEAFRPVGDRRIWTFGYRDSVYGNLLSTVESETTIDGEPALVVRGGMRIDFRKMGGEMQTLIQTEHSFSRTGEYLGDKLTFRLKDNQQEELNLQRASHQIEGYFTRNGQKVAQSVPWPRGYFAYDAFCVDQLEIYFAMHDLTEHQELSDTLFVPQILSTTTFRAQVGQVEWRELWKGKFDSIISVQITEPQPMLALVSLDHRLVRLDFTAQNFRAYQDLVQRISPDKLKSTGQTQSSSQSSVVTYTALAANYVAYVFIAALALIFVALRAFKWPDAYFALLFGAIVFGLIFVTQIPAQKYLVGNVVIPAIQRGGSLYLWGILPALAGGILQEILKLLGIYAVTYHREPPLARWTRLGAFVAAAFAIGEACYLAEPTVLLSASLFVRGSRIVYHVSSGVLLAAALGIDSSRRYLIIGGLMLVDTAMIYLPVFVQEKMFSAESLYFVMAAMVLVVLTTAVIVIRKFSPRPVAVPRETPPSAQ
jgi:hypothetical protein